MEKKKTYRITTKTRFLEPFWQELKDGSHPTVEYMDKQSYRNLNVEAALLVLKEFIDSPDEDLSLEDVKKEFYESNRGMSDRVAERIAKYYNGRKAIYEKLKNLLESGELEYEKVEIPEELNKFTTQEEDEDIDKEQQLEAWIEVKVED